MNAYASITTASADTSLAKVLTALAPHDDKALVLDYGDGRLVQAGYHVTEVKAGSFVTLDCGGNPDAWQETILQVEDIPAKDGETFMRAGKFRRILGQVSAKVRLNADARLTLEVSRAGEAMRVYDVADVSITEDSAIVRLGERPAICKPRHRAAPSAASEASVCCAPSTAKASSGCC
ncbi:MAG: DUF6428 family protein [Devosia sp.]